MEYSGFKITPDSQYPNTYRILRNGKGSIATALTGLYTTTAGAKAAIDNAKPKTKG